MSREFFRWSVATCVVMAPCVVALPTAESHELPATNTANSLQTVVCPAPGSVLCGVGSAVFYSQTGGSRERPAGASAGGPKPPSKPPRTIFRPLKFPPRIAVGRKVTCHVLGSPMRGTYTVTGFRGKSPPQGITISETGLLTWTPGRQDVGRHLLTIRAKINDQPYRSQLITYVFDMKGVVEAGLPEAGVAEFKTMPTPPNVTTMSVSEDGQLLIAGHEKDNRLSVWHVPTGRLVKLMMCPAPRAILCRGGKAYVSNFGKRTISVFDPKKSWELTDRLQVGEMDASYLSAPRGEYFKGQIVATCRELEPAHNPHFAAHQILVIDTKQDTRKKLFERDDLCRAFVDYAGETLVTVGLEGQAFRLGEDLGDLKATFRPEGFEKPSLGLLLYQVRKGGHWFSLGQLYKGFPPRPAGNAGGRMLVADRTQEVFYILGGQVKCVGLDRALSDVGFQPVAYPDGFLLGAAESTRSSWADDIFVEPVAVTHGKHLFMYLLDHKTLSILRCQAAAFEIPAVLGVPTGTVTPAGQDTAVVAQEGGPAAQPAETPEGPGGTFPATVTVGKRLTYNVLGKEVRGEFDLILGPKSIQISNTGVLTWTPTKQDVGPKSLKIRARVDGRVSFLRLETEVVEHEAAGPAAAPAAATFSKLPTTDSVSTMALSEDGRTLILADETADRLSVWEMTTGKFLKALHCPRPRSILWRGGKVYVANYGKGTVSVFAPEENWELVDQLEVGHPDVYYLSAPQAENYTWEILASCATADQLFRRGVMLIDTSRDTHRQVHRPRAMSVATVDYAGRYCIVQGYVGYSPSATIEAAFDYRAVAADEQPPSLGRGEHENTPVLHQVRKGSYWFGGNKLYKGMPPRAVGTSRGKMVIPDRNANVFYEFHPSLIKCVGLDGALTDIGTRPTTYAEDFKRMSPDRHPATKEHRRDVYFQHIAITLGEQLYFYVLDVETSSVYRCRTNRFKIPALVALARDAVDSPADRGGPGFPERIAVGETLTYRLFGKDIPGDFALLLGPKAIQISETGVLTWTPTKDDMGTHRLKIRARVEDRVTFLRLTITVVRAKRTADHGGAP